THMSTPSLHDALPIYSSPDRRTLPAALAGRGVLQAREVQLLRPASVPREVRTRRPPGDPRPGHLRRRCAILMAVAAKHVGVRCQDRKSTRLNSSHVKI